MSIFESRDSMKPRTLTKWHVLLLLLVLNIIGFALAKTYFTSYSNMEKTHQEANETSESYGVNVKNTATWAEFGIKLFRLLNSR